MKEYFQKTSPSEFNALRWSVISSEECAASGLSYEQAVKLVRELSNSTSGLCIVTDEAAHRILESNGSLHIQDEQSEDATKHFTETL
jgi:hypothetical protein